MTWKKLKEKVTGFEGNIRSASILLLALSLFGKFIGFAKLHFMGQIFGISKELDVFWVAFALPDLVFSLLIVGTVNAALVPVFIKIIRKKEQKMLHDTLNTVTALLFVMMLSALCLLYFAMPSIADYLFATKEVLQVVNISLVLSKGTAEYYESVFINLSRLMLLSPLLLSVSSIFGAYLQAHKRFLATALAPVMYNIGIVLGIVFFVKFAPQYGIYSLSFAVIFGSVLHFATQIIGVFNMREEDLSWTFKINKYVKEIAKLSLPRIFGLGVEQIAIMFNTFWSFTLGAGALSVYRFASALYLVPVDILAGSFLQAVFPHLNDKANANDNYQSLNKLYWKALVLLCFLAVPLLILFITLRVPIVRLVFGDGNFTWTATVVTSFTVIFFTPAILLQALSALNIRTFYAIHNTKTPFIISTIGVILNILFSIGFTNFFSHYHQVLHVFQNPAQWVSSIPQLASWFTFRDTSFSAVAGLALGISAGLFFEVAASFYLLSRKIGLLPYARQEPGQITALRTILISCAITFSITYLSYRGFDAVFDTSKTISIIILSAATCLICGVIYLATTKSVWTQFISIETIKRKLKITN